MNAVSVRGDRKLRANLQLLSPNVQKLLGGSPTGLSLGGALEREPGH
jgi:hypothetical protein